MLTFMKNILPLQEFQIESVKKFVRHINQAEGHLVTTKGSSNLNVQ